MTAPTRRAVPPFEVGRDVHGFADRITRGGWTLLRLVEGATVNEEHVESIVARLNAAPLDWPLRTAAELAIRESGLMGSTGEGHAMTAQAKPDPLGVECIYCGALKGKRCLVNPGAHRHLLQYREPHAARVRAARLRQEGTNG